MDQNRSTLALVTLAGATLAAAIAGPRVGGPDPAIMFAVLFASLTSSITGFAFSAVCGAILFHLSSDHVRMIDLMIGCSVANQAAMVWSLRRDIAWRKVAALVAAGLCGVPVGAWLLLHTDRVLFGYGVGAVLLAYGAYLPFGPPWARGCDSVWADAAAGFMGGVIGAAAALPSLPLTIWSQSRGLDRGAQRSLCQPFILAMQLASLLALGVMPLGQGGGLVAADLLCVPAGLLGTQIGMGCYRGLSNRAFAIAGSALLIVSGLSFLLSS